MPYSIDKYSGSTVAVVEDGTINNTLDIKLIGKNYAGYGEAQNENFVWLLENFASNTAPSRPITGQIWYDTNNKRLRVFNGTSFKSANGIEVGANQPTNPSVNGEFWYDTAKEQLYVWSTVKEEYQLVGPQSATGFDTTAMESAVLIDINGISHPVVKGTVNGQVECIISDEAFELENDPALGPSLYVRGFDRVKKGVTLRYTDDFGVSINDYVFWGSSSNALRLGGVLASDYARLSASTRFTSQAHFNDTGFTVGDHDDLEVFVENGNIPVISNRVGNTITFKTKTGTVVNVPMKLVDNTIVPGVASATEIGADTLRFKTVFADTFDGLATKSRTLYVNGNTVGVNDYVYGAVTATANTAAVRDADGNLSANTFLGIASSAAGVRVAGVTYPASSVIRTDSPVFTEALGLGIGANFSIKVQNGNLCFNSANGTPLSISGDDVFPGANNTSDIGTSAKRYKTVYATTFDGLATSADKVVVVDNNNGIPVIAKIGDTVDPANYNDLAYTIPVRGRNGVIYGLASRARAAETMLVAGVERTASVSPQGDNVVVRNSAGAIEGNITGTSASTNYANLAELATTAHYAENTGTADSAKALLIGTERFPASDSADAGTAVVRTKDANAAVPGLIKGVIQRALTADYAASAGSVGGQANSATIPASSANTPNTIALRDGNGNFAANIISAIATAAEYADLAEKYLTDAEYPTGTVVTVGGVQEVTVASEGQRAIGVISANPAYMMNCTLIGGQYVALKGRVPVRVVGVVKKGDRLVATNNGLARAVDIAELYEGCLVFGMALESCNCETETIIEAIIL